MIEIEEGSGNVSVDLGMADADEMIVKGRKWRQQKAADVLGLRRPRLSKMLRGQFRGIGEAKRLGCLARLGRAFNCRRPRSPCDRGWACRCRVCRVKFISLRFMVIDY